MPAVVAIRGEAAVVVTTEAGVTEMAAVTEMADAGVVVIKAQKVLGCVFSFNPINTHENSSPKDVR